MKLEDLVGKQILKIDYDYTNKIIIRFTDDTILILHSISSYYGETELDISFGLDELSDYEKVHIGLMSEQDRVAKVQAEELERQKHKEAQEKAYYEQLKRKFG